MNTEFGIRADLQGYPWHDIAEELETDGIKIKIHAGMIEVGYDSAEDEAKAKRIAGLYLGSHSLRTGMKVTANFNYAWRREAASDGVHHAMNLADTVFISDRIQVQVTQPGNAFILSQAEHDRASFSYDSATVQKALLDPVLEKAVGYFAAEVVGDDKPFYGIYKAIEVITKHLGDDGRKKLADLAGKNRKYADDLMNTTNAPTKRHAVSPAVALLDDAECVERAKILIEAYARSV